MSRFFIDCLGVSVGLMFLYFVGFIDFPRIELEKCQRENNVYKCERVYIPVEGE